MFASQLARIAVVCGLLIAANGCSHCGHQKHGVMDCLIGGGCHDCNTGCSNGCDNNCERGCGLHHRWKSAPQLGGETYRGNACGEAYYGDWKSHPPCADPCDCYGNHTGCADCCQDCRHLNKGRHCGLKGIVKSMFHGCDHGCDSCTTCPSGGCATGECTSCGH